MRLLFFKASWCTVCHAIEKTVPIVCEHIDCDENPQIAVNYNVLTLPLFIAVREDGSEIARIQCSNVNVVDKWFKELKDE